MLGGYVAGSQALRDILIQRGRPFLFSTSHPPAVVEGVPRGDPDHAGRARADRAALVEHAAASRPSSTRLGFDTGASETPITPVILGDSGLTPALQPGAVRERRLRDVGPLPDRRDRQGAHPDDRERGPHRRPARPRARDVRQGRPRARGARGVTADGSGLRPGRDLPLDSHLHTDLSPDSDVPIDAYAEQAVERGIAEIAITDHVDFDPRLPAFAYATYDDRLRVARDAAERWAGRGLAIRFGCELTWASRYEDAIRDHLRRHAYDFTIGSVHIGPDSPYKADRVAAFCSGRGLSEVVRALLRRGPCRRTERALRYPRSPRLREALPRRPRRPRRPRPAPELYEPILRTLVDTGMALEINVSGLRQAANETYPSEAIVALYRDLGGRRVTTGSDAHRADSFAFGARRGLPDRRRPPATGSVGFRRGGDAVEVAVPERFLARAEVA